MNTMKRLLEEKDRDTEEEEWNRNIRDDVCKSQRERHVPLERILDEVWIASFIVGHRGSRGAKP